MERRQLEYLVAVVDAGSVTRAAGLLHVAQPGVSAQLALLERELGEKLFDRGRYGIRPTEVGRVVVERARQTLAAFDGVRAAVDAARGLLRGVVTVGTVRGVPLGDLAEALARFRAAHGGVELRLVEAESTDLLARLVDGGVDIALVGLPGPAPAGLTTRTVLTDRLAVAVGPGDPWATRRRVTLAELATRDVVTFPRGTGNRDALDAAAEARQLTVRVGFEAGTTGALVDLARAGLGPAVLPSVAATAPFAAGLVVLDLTPAVRSRLAFAWPDPALRAPSPAARALLRTVLDAAGRTEPGSRSGRT